MTWVIVITESNKFVFFNEMIKKKQMMIVKRQNKKKIMMTLKKIESTKLDEKRAKKQFKTA